MPKRNSCIVESSLWMHFSEVFFNDMIPMAYIDACTSNVYFCELFVAFPFLAYLKTLLIRFQRNGCSYTKGSLIRHTWHWGLS